MRFSGLAALSVVGAVLFSAGCKDDPPETLVDVDIFSSTPHLDRIHLRVRDTTLTNHEYVYFETDIVDADVTSRDLSVEPAVVRLRQSRSLEGKPFLLYAQGFVTGNDRPVVAGAITLLYERQRTIKKRIMMNSAFVANDRDGDGFQVCGSFTPTTQAEEIGFLDAALACDCNDAVATINPFVDEQCDDFIDNNCTGFPPNENCEDCVLPQPCTTLPSDQQLLAGVGKCVLGTRACETVTIDGETRRRLSDTCVGAGSPDPREVPEDSIDNDCDGVVDEGSPCTTGTTRRCFLGHIDPEIDTLTTKVTTGVCAAGVQTCVAGAWDICANERRPQRPPANNDEQLNLCPDLWTGIGFYELFVPSPAPQPCDPAAPGNSCVRNGVEYYNRCSPLQQCDGADNNCNGFYDEEVQFDIDGDGYTSCGTTVAVPFPERPREHTEGGTDVSFQDCNDNDSNVNPGETQDFCNNGVDEDCRCDRGPLAGQPSVLGCGPDGAEDLFCDNSGRPYPSDDGVHVPVPNGNCATAGYYIGGLKANPGDGGRGYCYTCAANYGVTCDPNTATCRTAEAECTNCADQTTLTAPGVRRPRCGILQAGTCAGTTAPVWVKALGVDGAALLDGASDDCPAFDCNAYYVLSGDQTTCQQRDAATTDDAVCNNKPFCGSGDCCDPNNGNNCCLTPADVCPSKGLHNVDTVTDCQRFTPGTCVLNSAPLKEPIANGTDPRARCGSLTCTTFYTTANATGPGNTTACGGGQCVTCRRGTDIADSNCRDGACETRQNACPSTTQVAVGGRNACTYPIGCGGDSGPTSYGNVAVGQDPYNDCGGAGCNGNGACRLPQGGVCTNGSQCANGNCVDGHCCENACNGACRTCNNASGTCVAIADTNEDNRPGHTACTGTCTSCVAGTCQNRASGNTTEFVASDRCRSCDGAGGIALTSNGDGLNCGGASYCCAGNCVTPAGDFGATCGNGDCGGQTWQCNNTTARCGPGTRRCNGSCGSGATADRTSNQTCQDAGNCGGAVTGNDCPRCERCVDNGNEAVCQDYANVQDNAQPGICNGTEICNGAGDCVTALLNQGDACSTGPQCASGNCVDGRCCNASSCGTCQTCDGTSPGTCTAIAAGEDSNSCAGVNQYCCAGSCVTGGADFGATCGTGDCAGGTWACSANAAACSTATQACGGFCNNGVPNNGTCNTSGACQTTAGTQCADCYDCTVAGTTASCVAVPLYEDDGMCNGNTTCDGAGNCRRDNGRSCTVGTECASGNCAGNVCSP